MCLPPSQILSDTVVQTVNGLDEMSSFGFSVSSGVDVDGNLNNGQCSLAYSKLSQFMQTVFSPHAYLSVIARSGHWSIPK